MLMNVYIGIHEELVKWFVDTLGKRFHMNFLGYTHWFMSVRILQIKGHSSSVDQAIYAISNDADYLDSSKMKENYKLHKTTLPHDMIFIKEDDYISDEQVEVMSR